MSEEESYMSRRSGQQAEKMRIELIRSAISQMTGARFEIVKPADEYPESMRQAKWLLVAPHDNQIDRVAHADTVWESNDGKVCIESAELGSLRAWIESEYGEEAAVKALSMNLAKLPDDSVRKVFAKQFEITDYHIRGYEDILAKVSARTGVKIELGYSSGHGSAIVFMVAKFEAGGLAPKAKVERVGLALQALREALKRIEKFEKRWAKILQ